MREEISAAMKEALRAKDQMALSTMRLISAALKDRDIAARSNGNAEGIADDEILGLLQTMIKQRNESAKMYREGGRPELADSEEHEISIIKQFLPEQLDEAGKLEGDDDQHEDACADARRRQQVIEVDARAVGHLRKVARDRGDRTRWTEHNQWLRAKEGMDHAGQGVDGEVFGDPDPTLGPMIDHASQ